MVLDVIALPLGLFWRATRASPLAIRDLFVDRVELVGDCHEVGAVQEPIELLQLVPDVHEDGHLDLIESQATFWIRMA
jgi:hypothetical protein